ncbi:hypothetical protein V8G54_033943, partial [Vigna mungo]
DGSGRSRSNAWCVRIYESTQPTAIPPPFVSLSVANSRFYSSEKRYNNRIGERKKGECESERLWCKVGWWWQRERKREREKINRINLANLVGLRARSSSKQASPDLQDEEEECRPWRRRLTMSFSWASALRITILLLLLAAVITACFTLPVEKMMKDFLLWVDHDLGRWGPIVLAVAYIPLTVLAVPASVLTVRAVPTLPLLAKPFLFLVRANDESCQPELEGDFFFGGRTSKLLLSKVVSIKIMNIVAQYIELHFNLESNVEYTLPVAIVTCFNLVVC